MKLQINKMHLTSQALTKTKDSLIEENKKGQFDIATSLNYIKERLDSKLMEAQNCSAQNKEKDNQLDLLISELKFKLQKADQEKSQCELRLQSNDL